MASPIDSLELDLSRIHHSDTKLLAVVIMAASLGRKTGTQVIIYAPPSMLVLISIYRIKHLLASALEIREVAPCPGG